jgi:hypothetical protein
MDKPKDEQRPEDRLPPPGSWADVARIMAMTDDPNDPVDWDTWKEEMKDRDMDNGD